MNLQNLIVCRNLLEDEIFNRAENEFEISAKLIEKAEILGLSRNLFRSYLIYKLAHDGNLISETAEKTCGKVGDSLKKIFVRDIEILLPIFLQENFSGTLEQIKNYQPTEKNNTENLIQLEKNLENISDAEKIAEVFIEHYKKFGTGDIAACRAFRWDSETKNLVGIKNFEDFRLSDLIGYAHQKELLTKNTLAFLAKKPANNVLLVGARGTGKSSGVKALVNEYYAEGLRLVQITKPQLKYLSQVMGPWNTNQYSEVTLPVPKAPIEKFVHMCYYLASRRFIIFLDDLSFDESETEYKYLKSAIEGGVEPRPENILIYATSNRRHLIRETWRDRHDDQDELYRDDSVNETISLSDRFGLIIHYYAPTQTEYLEIIRHMLKKNGVDLEGEELRIEGLRWEMSHSGRNGRTAKQFVNFYLGQR